MLQPANRLTLIDAMRPPAGFRLESAMAVTYTLNLSALLAVPAAFALSGAASSNSDREDGPSKPGGGDGNPPRWADDDSNRGRDRLEPVELIHALRSHAGKLTVFSQAGEIALPPSQEIFAFLERAVVPVTASGRGIVHPKVWVIRYESAEEPVEPADGRAREQRLRVLVASRNLGFDESWDTLVRLDESADTGGTGLKPIGQLFRRLLDTAVGGASHDHRQRVRSLSKALKKASFALPEGVDELHVHVLGLTDIPSPLPVKAQRSLIISPFVSDDFFTEVQPGRIDELVSRQESLDGLNDSSLFNVARAYTFDDGSVPEIEAQADRLSPLDPGRPLVGLHAKVFAFEDTGRARLFLGSANATGPAFAHNVEILVELIGSNKVLGIDRLCEGAGEETGSRATERRKRGEEPGLRDLFIPYVRSPDGNGDAGGSSLDRFRREIAQLRITGRVEADPSRDNTTPSGGRLDTSCDGWSVTYRSGLPLPAQEGVAIHCWPLATSGHRRRVTGGEHLQARFETSLGAISGFLAFELVAEDEDDNVSRFVVPVPLEGLPDERDRLLLRQLIGGRERFMRYLMALLDEDYGETGLTAAVTRAVEGPGDDPSGVGSLPVLERLLRAMRRDPAKLRELRPLVSDLADDNALPPGFAELWETIHTVATNEAAVS